MQTRRGYPNQSPANHDDANSDSTNPEDPDPETNHDYVNFGNTNSEQTNPENVDHSNTNPDDASSDPAHHANPPDNASADDENIHHVFYKNQYNDSYKIDERVMRQIVYNNVRCVNPKERLKLIIYYKSQTVTSLVYSNNDSSQQNMYIIWIRGMPTNKNMFFPTKLASKPSE